MGKMPPECDPSVFSNGTAIAIVVGPRAHTLEDYCLRVRERSGQRVDWHYVGGRAVSKFLGDGNQVREALEAELESLRDAYMVCKDNFVAKPEREHVYIHWL